MVQSMSSRRKEKLEIKKALANVCEQTKVDFNKGIKLCQVICNQDSFFYSGVFIASHNDVGFYLVFNKRNYCRLNLKLNHNFSSASVNQIFESIKILIKRLQSYDSDDLNYKVQSLYNCSKRIC